MRQLTSQKLLLFLKSGAGCCYEEVERLTTNGLSEKAVPQSSSYKLHVKLQQAGLCGKLLYEEKL